MGELLRLLIVSRKNGKDEVKKMKNKLIPKEIVITTMEGC